jgi:cyclophilin family peptidyl-prolyl cis-trans isomerase
MTLILIAISTTLGVACGVAGDPTPTPWPTPTPTTEPKLTIDTSKQYIATLQTDKGDIEITLRADKTPITVDNFVKLARDGFYDGSTFHRVLPGFMAQGGDPTGTGSGGPGYTIQDEFTDLDHERGVIAMANTGQPNSGGSQFFLTYVPTPHLNGKHTVFGKVTAGMDVADSLTPRDPNSSPDFAGDKLIKVVIQEQ